MPRKKKKPEIEPEEDKTMDQLMRHYSQGTQDMESRMNRHNGWRDTLKVYLNQIPNPWPFIAKVTEPLVRTTILEKNGRLLNSKLRGRLVPREHGDLIKARVNNALLDFQWDRANQGGSMLEKIAMSDLTARIFGAAFVLVYWYKEKDCNEMKVIDNRDVLLDPRLDHIRSARDDNWVQIREWTTIEDLEAQGYEIPALKDTEQTDQRATTYDMVIKGIRGLQDYTIDPNTPVLEVVHELKNKETVTFLPKHKLILKRKKNPANKIQVEMLRYYPLPEDIYGESEVEPVMSIARTVNWFLSGFMEEGNKMLHPPIITAEAGVRRDTIVHTPGAIWIANNPDLIREMPMGNGIIQSFNSIYPMLKAAFNTAMGSQSLGVSNVSGYQTDKTATEVKELSQQQSSRDQYNQLYLGEFLKGIMMMWQGNNKRYLLDDPTKQGYVLRIIGQETMKEFKKMGLDEMDVSNENMEQIQMMIDERDRNGMGTGDEMKQEMVNQMQEPRYPVITNPEEQPENYNVVPKLEVLNEEEANLHIEKDDFDGEFDFIPDVASMAAGANNEQKKGRREAFEMATTPQAQQMLAADGFRLKGKELLSTIFQDNNFNDADSYFEQIQTQPAGASVLGAPPTPGLGGLPNTPGMAPAAMPMANPGSFPGQVQ